MIYVFREVNDDMHDRSALFHRLRAIVALILVLLYILGLVAMLAGRVQLDPMGGVHTWRHRAAVLDAHGDPAQGRGRKGSAG